VTGRDPFHYLTWLGARSAGLVAFGLAATAVIVGLAMSSAKRRPAARRRYAGAKDLHQQLALATLVAIAVHGALLVADRWLRPGLVGVLVPFATPYRPLWTGLGILAAYLAVLLGLSYYARQAIGARRWRSLHRFTPVIYVLAAAHLLGAGSDGGTLAARMAVAGTAIPTAVLLAVRLAQGYAGSGSGGRASSKGPAMNSRMLAMSTHNPLARNPMNPAGVNTAIPITMPAQPSQPGRAR
jgi:sulfoxide reductase heme-binding subunit YedZ